MSSTSTLLNSSDSGHSIPNASHVISRRRNLPGGRAIVGAFLIMLAAVGTFAISTGAGTHRTQTYVVATHDLAVGARIQLSDIRTISGPASNAFPHAFHTRGSVNGLTLLGPISAGELIQTGEVVQKSSSASAPEISFSLPAARALGGNLRAGETVDVLVTDKNQSGLSATSPAVTNAQVVKVDGTSSGLGHSDDVTVVLAVRDDTQSQAVANAVDLGQVTLVRTTGTNN